MSASETPESRRLADLIAFRERLQAEIAGCDSKRDFAALGRLHLDVLEQIEALEKAQPAAKGTALDELKQRRAQRETASAPRPPRRQQRG